MRQDWVGKRKTLRQNCMIRAEVRFQDDRPPIDCTIIDISKAGARLESADLAALPNTFDLFIPARDETKYARVVRREATFIGIQFLSSRDADPLLIGDLIKRMAQVEAVTGADPVHQAKKSTGRTSALEARIAALEAELAAVRGIAEGAANQLPPAPAPPAPDRMPEIQALHSSLSTLADRIEQAAALPPAVSPERFKALAGDVDLLRTQMTDLCAAMAALATPRDEPDVISEVRPKPAHDPVATAPDEDLAQEVGDLRKSVQTLILLVSQLIARTRVAA